MPTAEPRLFLIGATGEVGRGVVEALKGRPNVRALARSDASAAALTDAGLDVVRGDLGDPSSLTGAMDGYDRLFLLIPPTSADQPSLELAALDLAEAAGISHVVFLSTHGVGLDPVPAMLRSQAEAEERLDRAPFTSTRLRPETFMSMLVVSSDGKLRLPTQGARVAPVDPADLADLAVYALLAPEPPVGVIRISGPEAFDLEEAARRLSAALGRPVTYEPLSPREFRMASRFAGGAPDWQVDGIIEIWQRLEEIEPPVFDAQERLLGRPARTLEQWLAGS